ncbi:NAD(P)/FAD-dependent oxidoreductase [Ruminococcus difficilis]|uniref:NAD(P)/FAD-dependent oxidoreductase n=1 Tax=Ruminococcus difficilis TaxID=2763069 RepID=A0A934U3I9_9FIRM|nr:NAD(P)/FAD-dependent oxidoreductase [Ruminococcus difficilis]MBK6087774.1 NAD(P)/FAD-dependent oxidoreductase [Ruminococcus difficilis]
MSNQQTEKIKVLVIGAGPAGMMAAGAAAENGADVVIVEKNQRVGRKLAITGKGRCNITNFCDNETFIAHVTANPRFLYSAVNRFSCYDTVAFFEDRGLATKVERGNRVFPVSDKALDVVDTLYEYLTELGVQFIHQEVKGLLIENGSVKGVRLQDRDLLADKVIVTCGGMSYRATGSTGDGYTFAKSAGHTITPLLPSLVPLTAEDEDISAMQGLSLKNVRLSVIDNTTDKEVYSDMGEMLFTHFGISGPLVLSASAHMRAMSPGRYTAYIDLKPALDDFTLDKRILRDFAEFANKDIINSLGKLLPKKLIPIIIDRAGIAQHTKCNTVTASQRQSLLSQIKHFSVKIHAFRPINEAIVTHGGVDVKDIDPRSMESKLISGLYFAGEVLDLDAYTGGFNLQIAYCTGRLAGESAAQSD